MKKPKLNEPLQIAFCVNDDYVKYICVTIKSIIISNPNRKFNFHVLSDYISEKSKLRLNEVIRDNKDYNILLHYIDDTPLSGIKTGMWTKYTWYRIFLPEILKDIDTILYLDADIIVNGNLDDLFNLNIEKYSVAGVRDHSEKSLVNKWSEWRIKSYINAGVLLMNLYYWRKHSLRDKILEFARNNYDLLQYPDQDSINVVCRESTSLLPFKYGLSNCHFISKFFNFYPDELYEAYNSPVIIHFYGVNDVPWIKENNNVFSPLWQKYNKMLIHKVPVKYKTKGFLGLKIRIWDLFHNRQKIAEELVLKLFKQYGF